MPSKQVWQRFNRRWNRCRACRLYRTRKNVVIGRGSKKPHVLFIGEAPGRVEDLWGKPFVGPSGKLLDRALTQTCEELGWPFSYYITNICGCRPCDGRQEPNRPPKPDEATACRPRLLSLLGLLRPEKVVLLGESAKKECADLCPDAVGLYHPAYILRQGGASSLAFRRFVRSMTAAIGGE